MNFKEFYTEGRHRWDLFSIKRGATNQRWSFRNTTTNAINFIKIDPNNEIGSMQKFLKDIKATPGVRPKTQGNIDFHKFARDVIMGDSYKVYVKQGHFDDIKNTWILE